MTNGPGKSDRPVVPEKSPNTAGQPVAEEMEGSGRAKGNLPQQNASRTPSRNDASSALERVRKAAGKDKKLRFTALLHHISNLETLRMAYFRLKKEAAPGVDGETWRHYGEELEGKLQDLSERLRRGGDRGADRRPGGRGDYPGMAEGGRGGGWEGNTSGRGDAPRRKCFAAFGERLSSLRIRSVGPSVASETSARRCHRRAIRRRHRGWIQGQSGCRSVPSRTHRTNDEVQLGTASREDTTSGVLSVRDRPTAVAWRRETGDVQLPGLYAHLRKEEE